MITPFIAEKLSVLDLMSDGKAVCRLEDGRVIFVDQGVPGDVVDVKVWGKKKKTLLGDIIQIHEASAMRSQAPCTHAEICGGCKVQHLTYESQLKIKEKQVLDAFERIAGLEVKEIRPIIGANPIFEYRNKLEFTFSSRAWLSRQEVEAGLTPNSFALGFHPAQHFDKIIHVQKCHLMTQIINDIRNRLAELAEKTGLEARDIKKQTGFWRNVIFRVSEKNNEILVLLIVSEHLPEIIDQLFTTLTSEFPQVSSWLWMVNAKQNDSYSDLEPILWKGNPWLQETLSEFRYVIRPTSFFQTNSNQAEILYQIVKDAIPQKMSLIYDLYAGAGSIGIFVSSLAEKIIGVEYIDSAVQDAYDNCKLNNLNHLSYFSGDLAKILSPSFVEEHGSPNLVITDPPRAGMDPKVCQQLLMMESPMIIYVSCNPATQARDVALLSEKYQLEWIQPVDMFPHTLHVENVALLSLKK